MGALSDARPHIEVDWRGYHFGAVEREQEQERFTIRDLDELLYRIFQSVTQSWHSLLSWLTESRRWIAGGWLFSGRSSCFPSFSPSWAQRQAQEHDHILREHPFDDMAGTRAVLTRELREVGHSPETAWQMASERYPLPVPI
jgi:hypothetical protein